MKSNYEPQATEEELDMMLANCYPITLTEKNIPSKLRHLIFCAQRWGSYDDVLRRELLRRASNQTLQELITQVAPFCNEFTEWLAGSEAYQDDVSEEYVAFTKLRLALDNAQTILKYR